MALLARRLGSRSGRAAPAQLRHRRRSCRTPRRPARSTTAATTRPLSARALERFDYAGWRAEQARARADGPLLGIGIATSVEPAGTNLASYEIVTGRRRRVGLGGGGDGAAWSRTATCARRIGDPSSGQGYETVIAQIVADELGAHARRVRVGPRLRLRRPRPGSISPATTPTSSRSPTWAPSWARPRGARQAAAHRRAPAGDRLADLELRDGAAACAGAPDRRARLRELARTAYADVLGLPPGMEPGSRPTTPTRTRSPRRRRRRRVRAQLVFANAAHCCLVEVDPRTGAVKVSAVRRGARLRRELNPLHRGGHGPRLDGARHRRRAARGVPLRRAGPAPHRRPSWTI